MTALTVRIVFDIVWLAAVGCFGYFASGPAGVIATACFVGLLSHGAPRVQLWPSYATLPLALLSIYYKGLEHVAAPRMIAVAVPFIAWGGIALSVLAHVLLPHTVRMATPPGPYAAALHVVRCQSPQRGVDCNVRVYYPCKSSSAAVTIPYLYAGVDVARGVAQYTRMPAFLFTWTQYVVSTVLDADLKVTPSAGKVPLPVIVFSHGLGGTPDVYSSLITDWVSRGYVVLAVEHADGSGAFTRFPDGFKHLYQPLTDAERTSRPREYRRRHAQLQIRTAEVRAAVDLAVAVGTGAKHSPEGDDMWYLYELLQGKMSTTHVYAAGHSFGAATALAAADVDPRVRAVVALDPWMMPLSAHTLKRGLPRTPVLAVCGDGFTVWRENADAMRVLLSSHTRTSIAAADTQAFEKALASSMRDADAHAARRRTPKATLADSDDEADTMEGSVHAIGNGVARGGALHASLVAHPQGVHTRHVLASVAGVEHINFSDLGVLLQFPARMTRSIGKADPARVLRTLGALAAEFIAQVEVDDAAATAGTGAALTLRAHNSPWALQLASVPHPDLLTQHAWVAGASSEAK